MGSVKHIITILFIAALLLAMSSPAIAAQGQYPVMAWAKTYGGSSSDTAFSVLQADDGGYAVLGVTRSSGSGGFDIILLKLDAAGEKQWEKTYGGSGNEWAYDIQKSGAGYIIAGVTASSGAGGFDMYLLKVDSGGNKLWEKTYGGPGADAGFWVSPTSDGGYIVTGYKSESGDADLYMVRTDGSGNVAWENTYGGSGADWGKCVIQTSDGGFIACGWTKSFTAGDADVYLVKVDAGGSLQWHEPYGGPNDDLGYGVVQAPDGGYLLGGHTASYGNGQNDLWLVKVAGTGTEQWSKTYGDAGNNYGAVIVPEGDGYVLGGQSDGAGSDLHKVDASGNILWSNTYPYSGEIHAGSIAPATDGYVIAGNTNGYASGQDDIFVMKLTSATKATPFPATVTPLPPGATASPANGTVGGFQAPPMTPPDQAGTRAVMSVAALLIGGAIGALAIFSPGTRPQPDGGETKKKSIFAKLWDFAYGFLNIQLKSLIFKQESKIHQVEARQQQAFFLGISSLEWLVGGFAALALAVAYIVAKKAVFTPDLIILYMATACVVTGLHDFTHRYFAFKYKAVTEYQFWGLGFIAMFATAFFFGLLYGMPARTLVNNSNDLKPRELAIVYGSGPLVSFAASLVFLALALFGGPLASVGIMGVSMNLLSATYSLMPFKNMDGNKIYSYNKLYWALAFLPVLAIYFATMVYLF